MKKSILFGLSAVLILSAQSQTALQYEVVEMKTARGAQIHFSQQVTDLDPKLVLIQAAEPGTTNGVKGLKMELDRQRKTSTATLPKLLRKTSPFVPELKVNFNGNVTQGTPNDNDMAISNGGKIMSVVNSNVNMFNDSGVALQQKTLSFIAKDLGSLNRTYDPRVIYDPKADRFILVFLQGSTSADTRIIVGFSETNDPTQLWNFYAIPGNIFGDSSWSDYPIISLTETELFITVNRLKDNTSWQEGFIESLIWQVEKQKGYDGDSLTQRVYKDIKYEGKPVWSICPAKGGEKLFGPNMYFLSVRPSSLNNDTLFLHEITNTIASKKAIFRTRVLTLPKPYGLQPNAIMPNGKKLQTNDARVLSAMFQEARIHFVGNSIEHSTLTPGIYYGVIRNPWDLNPIISGQVIAYDTMDIGYPSISHMGGGVTDNSALITYSFVSPQSYPGTAAVFVDRNGEISDPIVIKRGLNNIQILSDSVQRWGDYTGNQRRYNQPGVSWICGSYGGQNGWNQTWIAELKSTDPFLPVEEVKNSGSMHMTLAPNPANEYMSIEFEMKETRMVEFEITDIQGKNKISLLRDKAKAGINRFSIAVSDLAAGTYFINILSNGAILHTQKLVVVH